MSKLAKEIDEKIVIAMKAKDKVQVSTLRMVKSAIKNKAIEKREELGDEEVVAVLMTLCKQRKDSIEQFRKGGRDDLADNEAAELEIIKAYLPEQMGEDEVKEVVEEVIANTGAESMKDMGKVMGQVMGRLKGKADGQLINTIVRNLLSGDGE